MSELLEGKAIRGKVQKAVMKALQHGKRELTDLARDPSFRGIHFAKIMKSVEALAKAGHVKFDPRTQVITLAEASAVGGKFNVLLEAIGGLEWPPVVIKARRIEGVVLQIDSFGNLITNVRSEDFLGRPTDERVCIICGIYETWGIYSAYAQQPQGTLIALVGSSGRLELAIVGDNAARRLGIQVGTRVIVTWE